jgi:DNA-binding NtrC family response regulator
MEQDRPHEEQPSKRARVMSDMAELQNLGMDAGEEVGFDSSGTSAEHPAAAWSAEQELQLLRGLSCAVSSELDLERLIRIILEESIHAIGADRGILFLGKADAAGLVPVRAMNLVGEELQSVERISRTILAQGRGGELVLAHDAVSDPRFATVESVKLNRIRSILCAPLVSPSGSIGVLYLDAAHPNAFPDGTARLMEAIAAIAATALEKARVHGGLVTELSRLRSGASPRDPVDRLLGGSPGVVALRQQAAIAAHLERPIWIMGETGSGRGLLARAIHDQGLRARQPFISCDCSLVAPSLQKGVILGRTGAAARGPRVADRGLLHSADRGTLYLAHAEALQADVADELAEVIGHGVFRQIGARRDQAVDVRLIVSTRSQDAEGGFEGLIPPALVPLVSDLRLAIPPLRERPEDIPELISHFLRHETGFSKERSTLSLKEDAIALLQAQAWPGNVKELRHVVGRMVFRGSSRVIGAEQVAAALASAGRTLEAAPGSTPGRVRSLREREEEAIREALRATGGNKGEAANLLGIHRNTLILKARRLGL